MQSLEYVRGIPQHVETIEDIIAVLVWFSIDLGAWHMAYLFCGDQCILHQGSISVYFVTGLFGDEIVEQIGSSNLRMNRMSHHS